MEPETFPRRLGAQAGGHHGRPTQPHLLFRDQLTTPAFGLGEETSVPRGNSRRTHKHHTPRVKVGTEPPNQDTVP